MSRPKPNVIFSHTNPDTNRTEEVLEATGIYAVFLNGLPVNLRTLNSMVSYPGPKYRKVSFSNPGHAFNLCTKLNNMFKTTTFTVVLLVSGQQINEG